MANGLVLRTKEEYKKMNVDLLQFPLRLSLKVWFMFDAHNWISEGSSNQFLQQKRKYQDQNDFL